MRNAFKYLTNSIANGFLKESLCITAYVDIKRGHICPSNWGDDLNIHLLEALTGKRIEVVNRSLTRKISARTNYLCIGSTLGWLGDSKTEVWGAGIMNPASSIRVKPRRIHAVRGPLTRDILLRNGIMCPSVFGDPALLLPLVYNPPQKKRYRIGIIPHISDLNDESMRVYAALHPNVCIINLQKYKHWTDIVDELTCCEAILSSSLHGLIAADAYQIPNHWIRMTDKPAGGSFKYKDYFASVQRTDSEPLLLRSIDDWETGTKAIPKINEAQIDLTPLWESCPFKHLLKNDCQACPK